MPPLIGMRPMIGSARLLKLSKDRPTSPACSYWWHGSTRGGSRFRLTQIKTDRLGSSPCRGMKSGWQDPLLFCPRQICFRSSTKSASKLGLAQTTPDRAKSRNAGAFSRVTTWESSAARVGAALRRAVLTRCAIRRDHGVGSSRDTVAMVRFSLREPTSHLRDCRARTGE